MGKIWNLPREISGLRPLPSIQQIRCDDESPEKCFDAQKSLEQGELKHSVHNVDEFDDLEMSLRLSERKFLLTK